MRLPKQEVYRVRLQFQLEQVVVAGGRGRLWTSAVKGVCNDFLHQLQILSDCKSDASEPADGVSARCLPDRRPAGALTSFSSSFLPSELWAAGHFLPGARVPPGGSLGDHLARDA